jgi:hypothetical protein
MTYTLAPPFPKVPAIETSIYMEGESNGIGRSEMYYVMIEFHTSAS